MRNTARTLVTLGIVTLGAITSLAMPAQAGGALRVIELFTSQGCSSCPPADRLLGEIADRRDIVALSYNVDYWDYLGWSDTLAKPAFSQRQRAYARKRGDGQVYTPQMVINGQTHIVGSDRRRLAKVLKASAAAMPPSAPDIEIENDGSVTNVTIRPAEGRALRAGKAMIWAATVDPSVTVKIRRGENYGRTITYRNVVRDLIPLGVWKGGEKVLQLDTSMVMKNGIEACAILIQDGDVGPILGGAWLD